MSIVTPSFLLYSILVSMAVGVVYMMSNNKLGIFFVMCLNQLTHNL